MIKYLLLLLLVGCSKPKIKHDYVYKANDVVTLKGFYSNCYSTVVGFDPESNTYNIRLHCSDVFYKWVRLEEIERKK